MNSSTEDKIVGSFREAKGAIKEEVGRVTNNHCLEIKGKVEKTAGKIQRRVGDAKQAAATLQGQLEKFFS